MCKMVRNHIEPTTSPPVQLTAESVCDTDDRLATAGWRWKEVSLQTALNPETGVALCITTKLCAQGHNDILLFQGK